MIKLMNDGRLCCQSFFRLAKYASSGHLIMSDSDTFLRTSEPALTVVFSSKGASIVNLGVANKIVKELKCEQLHLM